MSDSDGVITHSNDVCFEITNSNEKTQIAMRRATGLDQI